MIDFEGEVAKRIQNKELTGVVLGRIDMGRVVDEVEGAEVGVSILKVKDGEGELYLPGFDESVLGSLRLPQGAEMELDERQKERLGRAIELRLPPLVAVHLALNTDRNLEEYGPAMEGGEPGYIIGVYGEPGQFKSKSMAILGQVWGRAPEIEVETVGFDSYSARGVVDYQMALQAKREEIGRELRPEEMIEAMKRVDAPGQEAKLSLKETLDNYADSFKGGNQADIYLVDLPGLGDRKMDGFDVLALYGMVTIVAQRGRDEEATLLGYVNELAQFGGMMTYELMLTDANRIGAFNELVSRMVTKEMADSQVR